ncbi:hypothetical protein ANO11243_083660 [Dothideomycetidae sp. 11243]|nr:hypothetical protein ANO11243_083660 [fungal sp. No.11243]
MEGSPRLGGGGRRRQRGGIAEMAGDELHATIARALLISNSTYGPPSERQWQVQTRGSVASKDGPLLQSGRTAKGVVGHSGSELSLQDGGKACGIVVSSGEHLRGRQHATRLDECRSASGAGTAGCLNAGRDGAAEMRLHDGG